MPMMLKNAVQQKMALRRGRPLHTWQNLGLAHGGSEGRSRLNLITGIQQYLLKTEEQIDRRVHVATALWDRGLLMTEKPFK
ncbi:hypothetical protein KR067_004478 [Drosophila pandora]|nr:hypothetical protein KR067_004478 [Drosophila pandora]